MDGHEGELVDDDLLYDDDEWYDLYEQEVEDGRRDSIHIKWIADGSKTLDEVATCLRDYATYIEELRDQGYVLEHPVDNSHGELVKQTQ